LSHVGILAGCASCTVQAFDQIAAGYHSNCNHVSQSQRSDTGLTSNCSCFPKTLRTLVVRLALRALSASASSEACSSSKVGCKLLELEL
jgi:hypothetical protein